LESEFPAQHGMKLEPAMKCLETNALIENVAVAFVNGSDLGVGDD